MSTGATKQNEIGSSAPSISVSEQPNRATNQQKPIENVDRHLPKNITETETNKKPVSETTESNREATVELYSAPTTEKQVQQVNSLNFEVLAMNISEKECELFYEKKNDPRPYISVIANRTKGTEGLLDTGAMISVIGFKCQTELEEWQCEILPVNMTVTGYDRSEKSAHGRMNVWFTFDGETKLVPMILVPTPKRQIIFGMNFCKAFGIKLCREKNLEVTACVTESLISFDEPEEDEWFECEAEVAQTTNVIETLIGNVEPKPADQTSLLRPTIPDTETTETRETYCMTSNESTTKAENWGLPEIGTLEAWNDDQLDELGTYGVSPIPMLLELCTLEAEQRPEPDTVRTADGSRDTVDDILPEKHQCVTQPHELSPKQHKELQEVVNQFPYTPESGELNCTGLYEQSIDTGNAKPIIRRQYPMSPQVLKEATIAAEELIQRGIVEVIGWSTWRWPILYVRKASGGGRICLDARGLNALVDLDSYPSLDVDSILRRLPTVRYITSLDMTQAFHQIAIRKEDQSKTAFSMGNRLYCFKRAVMGFKNSPADLTKLLDRIFHDMPNVYHYVDDFVIVTDTFESHVQVLKGVAKRLRDARLSISQKKSNFCCKQLTFLGYVLSEEGLGPNPDRIKPIINYKRPETVKDIRRLVGLVNWYRRFIPDAATLLTPLTDLIKQYGPESQRKIQWKPEHQQAFDQVKHKLTEAPILTMADYSLPFKIYSDASLVAGAAILTQVQGGSERVIAYHSVKFSTAQQNYSATERELLSVIAGLEKFRPWIDGTRITVVTDHQSIKWLNNLKEPAGKLARWAVRLQAFDIDFIHRPGKEMNLPDALSRAVDLIELDPEYQYSDPWYNQMKAQAAKTNMDHYKIENGMLYHRNRPSAKTEHSWTLCLPKEKVTEALTETHNEALHPGVWKTIQYAKRCYYWPRMYQQIQDYVTKCTTCRVIKPTNEQTKTPVGTYRDPGTVGRMISIDLIGPLPASKIRAHQYAVVAVDCFSKYVFTKSMKSATATNVVDFLEKEIFYKFGVPEVVICDNGVQFASKLFDALLLRFKVRKLATPLYYAQANPVEATNKTIKTALRAKILELHAEQTDWEYFLPEVTMRINTLPHTSTGMSAHYIVFGRDKPQSGNEYRILIEANPQNTETEVEDKREAIFDEAAEQQRATFEMNKERYNLRAVNRKFSVGDEVLISNMKLSSAGDRYTQKLAPKKVRARIKEKVGSDTYLLTDLQGKEIGRYNAKMIMTR